MDITLRYKNGYTEDGKEYITKGKLLLREGEKELLYYEEKFGKEEQLPEASPAASGTPKPEASPAVSGTSKPEVSPDVSETPKPEVSPDVSGTSEPEGAVSQGPGQSPAMSTVPYSQQPQTVTASVTKKKRNYIVFALRKKDFWLLQNQRQKLL